MLKRALILATLVVGGIELPAVASDWIFDYGPYTTGSHSKHRVDQYKKNKSAVKIPYSKYFSDDGPSPYIPYWYYQDELGPLNGFYGGGGAAYGGGTNALPTGGAFMGGGVY